MSHAKVRISRWRLSVISIAAAITVAVGYASMSASRAQKPALDLSDYTVSFNEDFANLDISRHRAGHAMDRPYALER